MVPSLFFTGLENEHNDGFPRDDNQATLMIVRPEALVSELIEYQGDIHYPLSKFGKYGLVLETQCSLEEEY
jgi:hypothetical protein